MTAWRFVLVVLGGSAVLAACERGPTELRMVRPVGEDNVTVSIAKDIVSTLDDNETISIALTEEGLSDTDALDALAAGDADIAMVSNSMPYRPGVSTVISLYPVVLHVTYFEGRDDSDGRTLLQGAKVFAGPAGSASRILFGSMLERLGLTEDDIRFVPAPSRETPRELFPDVFVLFIPMSPAETLAQDGIPEAVRARFRLASMGSPGAIGTGSVVDSITLLNPYLEPFIVPIGTYGDIPEEAVLTIAVDMVLVARRDLDSAIVYDLVREFMRHRPALAAQRPGIFGHVSNHLDTSNSTFVLHPGSVAYERRDEPSIYERYSGIAEVVVTLFVGLVSAGFAANQMYQVKRKNRIDVFYARVLEIRKRIADESSNDDRMEAIANLKKLQAEAFEKLIDEKLAADESFRIFLAMSSDIIKEISAETA